MSLSRLVCPILFTLAASVAVGVEEQTELPLDWALATSEELSWEDADATCTGLENGGHTDWRLPDIDELVFETETLPPDLRDRLREERLLAWSCNRQRYEGPEGPELERLAREEIELERELCRLEGGVECESLVQERLRWQYRFGVERPFLSKRRSGSPLCVRGGTPACGSMESASVYCLQVVRSADPLAKPVAGILLQRVGDNGALAELGRSDRDGFVCLRRPDSNTRGLVLACDGLGCGAMDPAAPTLWRSLVVDPPEYGRVRGRQLCLVLRSSTGRPIFGAQVIGVGAEGSFQKLGETRPSGRRCMSRTRTEELEVVIVCSRVCRAVPQSLFEEARELILTIPEEYTEGPRYNYSQKR